MNKNKLPGQNYRTFELRGRTIIIDDFTYRRIFKDPEIKPRRKYTFIYGFKFSQCYVYICLKNRKEIALSRYIMRACKGEIVDHINRNPLDNRRKNLRIVNARQNNLNRTRRNNSGFIGVCIRQEKEGKYCQARYRLSRSKVLTFRLPDSPHNRAVCAMAHDKFVIQSGEEEYAPLNFPCWKFEPFRSFLLTEDLRLWRSGA